MTFPSLCRYYMRAYQARKGHWTHKQNYNWTCTKHKHLPVSKKPKKLLFISATSHSPFGLAVEFHRLHTTHALMNYLPCLETFPQPFVRTASEVGKQKDWQTTIQQTLVANIPDSFSSIKLVPLSDHLHSDLEGNPQQSLLPVCTWIPAILS